ncbi:MAG: menaquinone biosynthetic enzyme MqnA/MqnD family protein [Planctomycetota bacterium]
MDSSPETRWRVGTVPYLVAKPLTTGLASDPRIDLVEAPPSILARKLRAGELDVALASSVLALDEDPLSIWTTGPVIACDGPIHSVLLFLAPGCSSTADLRNWSADPHSHTGRRLTQWLLDHAWHNQGAQVHDLPAGTDPFAHALDEGIDAVQLIGDPALAARRSHPDWTCIDLGAAWKDFTGGPFVFAGWMSRSGFELGDLAGILERAATQGLSLRPTLVKTAAAGDPEQADFLHRYLVEDTRYRLPEQVILDWLKVFACHQGDDTVLGA